jgi:hypothetical protein
MALYIVCIKRGEETTVQRVARVLPPRPVLTVAFLMPDIPAATARRQSRWGTPLPSPRPKQNCCNSTTANLWAASPAPSARDSYEAIPAGYAHVIKGRTLGQNCTDRGYPLYRRFRELRDASCHAYAFSIAALYSPRRAARLQLAR